MTIQKLSEVLGVNIKIEYMTTWLPTTTPWYCAFNKVEVKSGNFLKGEFACGSTPQDALEKYTQSIIGKVLVIDAFSDKRSEFNVPNNLTVG